MRVLPSRFRALRALVAAAALWPLGAGAQESSPEVVELTDTVTGSVLRLALR